MVLQFSESQCDRILDNRRDHLTDEMKHHLRVHYPGAIAYLNEEQFTRRVQFGIERARGHGVKSDFGFKAFVSLMFLVAPDFDRDEEVARVLATERPGIDDGLASLNDRISEELWLQIADRSVPSAWGD